MDMTWSGLRSLHELAQLETVAAVAEARGGWPAAPTWRRRMPPRCGAAPATSSVEVGRRHEGVALVGDTQIGGVRLLANLDPLNAGIARCSCPTPASCKRIWTVLGGPGTGWSAAT